MTEYAFTLQPLNEAAFKNWHGKIYVNALHANQAHRWFQRHVPDAQFAVRRCVVTNDDSGCEVVKLVGDAL